MRICTILKALHSKKFLNCIQNFIGRGTFLDRQFPQHYFKLQIVPHTKLGISTVKQSSFLISTVLSSLLASFFCLPKSYYKLSTSSHSCIYHFPLSNVSALRIDFELIPDTLKILSVRPVFFRTTTFLSNVVSLKMQGTCHKCS